MDSSVLAALILRDDNCERALELVQDATEGILISSLLELEVGNAIQLCLKSGRLREAEAVAAKNQFRLMRETGYFEGQDLDWERVFLRAKGMSEAQTAVTGTRSLDILHVASAIEWGAGQFWTFDRRQGLLAEKVGLKLAGLA